MTPIDLKPRDALIDTLVDDLRPTRPLRRSHDAAILAGLAIAEILLFVWLRGMRSDVHEAMLTMAFWWKAGSLAVIAVLAAAATLVSLDPAANSRPGLAGLWRAILVALPAMLALGWLLDAGAVGRAALVARLEWREGVACLVNVLLLSLPFALALGVLIRRGASVQPARTALAAGLAAAGFGAFVFAFHCNHDDPLYVAVWYGGAVAGIGGLARLIVPRLTRW